MDPNLRTVLESVVEVFGLVAVVWVFQRRRRLDLSGMLQIGMQILVPCLGFTAIIDSRIRPAALAVAVGATFIQIGSGLLLGWLALRLLRWRERRELLLPIAFVNAANLAFPLVLANFGEDGLSVGVTCYTVMTTSIFTAGVLILHGGGRLRQALAEPTVWSVALAAALRLLHWTPPSMVMAVPHMAAQAAVPVMLVLFGDALSRTRLSSVGPALAAVVLRYASGIVGLWLAFSIFHPEGVVRNVLILYGMLPSAVITVALTQKAGRDEQAVASAVLLATLVSVPMLPILLLALR
jgi:hypothetical protein